MFAASKTAAAAAGTPPPSTDPQFNYVTMLLHGDGTNGAQNNTFVDSSSNNFTVTRNGTPTQGSFSPYGDLWSNYFSGTQLLTIARNSAFYLSGSFTVEAWVFMTAEPPTDNNGTRSAEICNMVGGGQLGFEFNIDRTNNRIEFLVGQSSNGFKGTGTVTLNTWHHIAVVFNGTSGAIYLNGTSLTLTSTNWSWGVPTGNLLIGGLGATGYLRYFPGYISNLRIVKGTALYTSNFTPSTTPLTAVSGTSLLTCQSNRFKDNSSNNFAITVTGTPSVQRFSPFDPAAEYSTSVIGGSGYFNGSQSLSAPAGTAFNFGTGEFTAECWCYSISRSAMMRLFAQTGFSVSNVSILFEIATTGVATAYVSTGSGYVSATGTATVALNAWTHVAMVRDVNTLRLYVNGVQSGTASLTGVTVPSPTSPFVVGCNGDYNANFFPGYISGMRVVKGTCVYPSGTTFTPPTAPLTAITNTSLLLNTVNAGIVDNAMMNDLVTVGNAQISTSVKKYGTGSMAFDGTGDWLTFVDSPNVQLGAGDFTIEGWVYLSALGTARGFLSKGTSTTGFSFGVNALNQLVFNYTATSLTATTPLLISTWYYVAVVRSGSATGNLKIYLNGSVDATSGGAVNDNFNQTSIGYVGADRVATSPMNGYIDDLRITKGIARTITTPTAAFPNN